MARFCRISLAKRFLKKKFDEMRYQAMRRNGYQKAYMSKKEWFRKSWTCQNAGGFLLLAKEEVLGDGLSKSVEYLKDELSHFVDDVDSSIAEFWQEAMEVCE